MPIRPENRAKYPKDWGLISLRIRHRANQRCEECDVRNGAVGGRTRDGLFHVALPLGERMLRLEWPKPGEYWWCEGAPEQLRTIRIVLTVAHLNHDPADCRDENLRALCQRCHLRYDARHHAETARQTRRQGKALGDLFAP